MKSLVRNRWMLVPVALLTLSVVMAVLTVTLAVANTPLGVVPDYYHRAESWDAERAQRAANDRLAWTVTPQFGARRGERQELVLVIEDKYGHPIDSTSVELITMPLRDRSARTSAALERLDAGRFRGEIAMSGPCEFVATIRRGDDVYVDAFRRAPTGKDAP